MSPDRPDPGRLLSEGESSQSPRRREWREHLGAETRDLLAADERHFLRQSLSTPCLDVLRACSGSFLEDLEGRRYLDFHGNSVHQVGFGHPHVIAALQTQLAELPFCPRRFTNRKAIALAAKLAELAPGDLDKVLLAPGGASAIGMALKLARVATGRHKTISMWESFHGASLDAISIGGEAVFREGIGPLLPGCEHVPPPDPGHCPFGCARACDLRCADYVEYVLAREGDVAAVVAETVRSAPFIPPPEYWRRIRAACDRHGALLVLDEIPNCLGRTGRMFACEHYDVVPDMLVVGKGLGGGLFPIAALIARAGLDVAPDHALGHFTHEKSPLGAAAALATIEVIESEGLLDRACELGERMLARLRALGERHRCVSDVRGIGLLLGVEFGDDAASGRGGTDIAEAVMYAALRRGLSFKVTMGSTLTLVPPLTLSDEECELALSILDQSFADVLEVG